MRFFREQTTGNVILMGRKTFDSLGRKCLPRRHNIVISHHFNLFAETAECRSATGIEDALFRATLAPKGYKECFVIGGASMYEQFACYADRYLVTLVEKDVPDGDTFFNQDPLGDPDEWKIRPLFSCPSSDEDEAAFAVFEVVTRSPELFLERRLKAIEQAKIAATSGNEPRSRKGSRRPSIDMTSPTYSMF